MVQRVGWTNVATFARRWISGVFHALASVATAIREARSRRIQPGRRNFAGLYGALAVDIFSFMRIIPLDPPGIVFLSPALPHPTPSGDAVPDD
ncbi:hypothetical protein Mal15_61450 [Stieleria maiorica]|uniref:Uncharacterized protein n=1 Tax=Stieleria maiorica TaxID=2795974 RepID=A0A5B9ML48_9BACT|nr:hypothetical protein Mal15_61450 [Stieleria maiorica]